MRPPARAPQALRKSRRRLPAWLSLRGRSPVRSGASPSCRTTSCTGPSSTAAVISLPWSSPTSSSVMCAHSSVRFADANAVLGNPGQPTKSVERRSLARTFCHVHAELAGEFGGGAHPPGIGHKLCQPPDVHLFQAQHYHRPTLLSADREEHTRTAP